MLNATEQTYHTNSNIPFNPKHLVKFKRELRRAGDFDTLMRKKQALQTKKGVTYIPLYKDIDEYKQKFLVGGYVTLRPHYHTEVPYVFWSKLYMTFVKKSTMHQI